MIRFKHRKTIGSPFEKGCTDPQPTTMWTGRSQTYARYYSSVASMTRAVLGLRGRYVLDRVFIPECRACSGREKANHTTSINSAIRAGLR